MTQAEKLREALDKFHPAPPAYKTAEGAARIVVTELGITREMVEFLLEEVNARRQYPDSHDETVTNEIERAASAWAALLEVANR